MAQELSTTTYNVIYTGTISDSQALMTGSAPFSISSLNQLENGEGEYQGNFVWSAEGKLGVGDSITFDLYGTTKDLYCNVMALETLKAIVLKNTGSSPISLTTNGISFITGTTPKIHVGANSVQTIADLDNGWTITDGVADTITIENTGTNTGTVYEIMFVGVQTENSSSSSSHSSASSESSSSESSSSNSSSSVLKSSSSSESSLSSLSSSSSSLSSPSSSSSSPATSSSSTVSSSSSSPLKSSSSSSSSSSEITETDMVLLNHFNGTNGQTTARDWSNSEHPLTFVNDSQLSTAQTKFGTASLLLDGSDYITIPDSSDWSLNGVDFTIDCWIYITSQMTSSPDSRRIISSGSTGSSAQWMFGIGRLDGWGSGIRLNFGTYDGSFTDYSSDELTGWTYSAWHHVAVVHDGSNFKFFLDGTQYGTVADGTIPEPTAGTRIGCQDAGAEREFFNGYIDELRVLNGKAYWTGAFTPPTQEYKNASASSSSSST